MQFLFDISYYLHLIFYSPNKASAAEGFLLGFYSDYLCKSGLLVVSLGT